MSGWKLMTNDLSIVQDAIESRVRRENPLAARVLDFFAAKFPIYDGSGFTVMTDWLINNWRSALKQWPSDLQVPEVSSVYLAVFPEPGARKVTTQKCENPRCAATTDIVGRLNFGHGGMSSAGVWRRQCEQCTKHFLEKFGTLDTEGPEWTRLMSLEFKP